MTQCLRDFCVTSWLPNLPTEAWELLKSHWGDLGRISVSLSKSLRPELYVLCWGSSRKLSCRNIFVVLVQDRLILPLESLFVRSFDRQWSDTSIHLATQSSPRPLLIQQFWKRLWHSVSHCVYSQTVQFVLLCPMLVFWVEQPLLAVDFMHITGFVTVVNRFVNYVSLTSLVHNNCTLILAWV